jgi:hypothetical protein
MPNALPRSTRLVTAAAFALASLPGVALAQAYYGCGKDTDCKYDRICRAGQCVDAGGYRSEGPPPPPVEKRSWRNQRLGVYYHVVVPVSGDNAPPNTAHGVGIESLSRIFAELRYRFALGYQAQPPAGPAGVLTHGIRSDLLTLGYTITVLDQDGIQVGIEPIVNLFHLETYFPAGAAGTQVDLGSGWAVGGIFGFGSRHGYVCFEPIGMDLRWLRAGEGIPTVAALGASWRIRLSAGVAF